MSFAGEVEGVSLRLAALEAYHPLLSQAALAQLLQWHYIRAARPQLYKLVGSANVIGECSLDIIIPRTPHMHDQPDCIM